MHQKYGSRTPVFEENQHKGAYVARIFPIMPKQLNSCVSQSLRLNRILLSHSTARVKVSSSYLKQQFRKQLAANASCSIDGILASNTGSVSSSITGGPSRHHQDKRPTTASQLLPAFRRDTMAPITSPVESPYNTTNILTYNYTNKHAIHAFTHQQVQFAVFQNDRLVR